MSIPSQVADVRWNLTPPPALDPHAYFDKWAADPHTVHTYSLRDQTQLNTLATTSATPVNASPGWVVDSQMGAAKGTVFTVYPHDGDIVPKLVIADRTSSGFLTYVWDVYLPAAWSSDPQSFVAPIDGPLYPGKNFPGAGIPSKAFQATPTRNGLGVETRLHNLKNSLPAIAIVDWRVYLPLGPGAWKNHDPYGHDNDTVQPLLTRFEIQADRWTRFFQHIEFEAIRSGGVVYDLWSLWVADERHEPVQLYDRLPLQNAGGVYAFWFEYDESQSRAPGSPPKSVYNRNFLMFRGITDPVLLLQKPIG